MRSVPLERRLFVALLVLAGVVAALALPRPAAALCGQNDPNCDPGGGGDGGGDAVTRTLTIHVDGLGTVAQGTTTLCSLTSGTNASTKTCAVTYRDGAVPTLTTTAAGGYGFVHWTGDCSGSSCAPTMNGDKDVTAVFVDNTPPPAARITGPAASPAVIRSDDAPSLTFTTNNDTASTRCAVDNAFATACTTPWRLPAMTDGAHTLHVQSLDVNGNLIDVTRQISYVNVPDTTLTGTPAEGAAVNTTATDFTFPALALCKLDDSPVACTNVSLGAVLGDGSHTLSVAAGAELNSTGYYDKTPAVRHWTVDTHAPDTVISGGPTGATTERAASFPFAGADPAPGTALHYMCRLDGAAWSACDRSGTQQYTNLSAGSHTFDVEAVDAAGNVDPSPASRSWTVLVDADGDGFYNNTDCNDSNPAVHPGAVDTPGDGIDQDCSGADAPVASGSHGVLGSGPSSSGSALAAKLRSGFKLKGKNTLVRKLALTGVPAGARVTVRCSGHGCPFKRKSFRPKHGTVNLTRAFRHRKLGKGARLEIDVTMAGAKTEVFKLATRAGRKPIVKTA